KNFLAQPADTARYFQNFPTQSLAPRQSVPPLCASAPPVKGVLRLSPTSRKRFFHFFPKFKNFLAKINNINDLTNQNHTQKPTNHTQTNTKQPYPQSNPQTRDGLGQRLASGVA
ncbi:hypothetical protein, partial [Shimia sp. R9_3]|uniref:hypothetical protein n=1 Tax=Shimia sp. R9_3 TaxID=2821113 RepID=UPI001AD9B582